MAASLIASVMLSIGSYLAQRGRDVLVTVFRGAVDKGTEKVAELSKKCRNARLLQQQLS